MTPLPAEVSGNPSTWADAVNAALLFAIDPIGIGGVVLRSRAGPVRERWLDLLSMSLADDTPVRRVPLHISDGRLLGGLDLAATLQAGRPVAERALLAEAHGGVVLLGMAERLAPRTVAAVTGALDAGEIVLERDGLAMRVPAAFGVVALDEGIDDERVSDALLDRLALHVDLDGVPPRDAIVPSAGRIAVADAHSLLPQVRVPDDILDSLCFAACTLGIGSLRVPLLALRVARAAAALAQRTEVIKEDALLAARLVLAPRATRLPTPEDEEQQPEAPDTSPQDPPPDGEPEADNTDRPLDDLVLAAAQAAIPADLLAQLLGAGLVRRTRGPVGAGAAHISVRRGRPVGTRRGDLRAGARLNILETLRAAAPWQPLRRGEAADAGQTAAPQIVVRREDFRITRFKQRTATTTIFVVDASGSSALNRLAEAKGAVELLLAECYVRRDQAALLAFRGRTAELLLPPTRSLVRAKRSLADLPGGGGTPLGAAIEAATALADAVRRKGQTPIVVFLTDGRANVARDGGQGREHAEQDAVAAARLARAAGVTALVVDISPQPAPQARRIATELDAHYLPLPRADAATLSHAIMAATARES